MTGDEQHREPHLRVRGLEKTFQSGDSPLTVLSGLDLEMDRGDQLAITGPSGICSMGVNVLQVGPVPTPALAFLTADMRCDAGAGAAGRPAPHAAPA